MRHEPQTTIQHPAPSPLASWLFHPSRLRDGELVAVVGPNLHVSGFPTEKDGGLTLEGPWDCATYPWIRWAEWTDFPKQTFTIDLEVSLAATDQPMGLAGCIFATDDGLRGWTLNRENGDAVFQVATAAGIATVRARMVPVKRFITLTGSYDGQTVRLYLNGKLADSAAAALGPIVLNGRTPFAVGGWWQGDKTLGFRGVVRAYSLYGTALDAEQVAGLDTLRKRKPAPIPEPAEPSKREFVIAPTIQQVSADSATIVWEWNGSAKGEVRYGEGARTQGRKFSAGRVQKVHLSGLKPRTPYTFQVCQEPETGSELRSEVATFTTMPLPGTPFRFAVVGDTQDHPEVNAQVATGMLSHHPAFALIVGDLVGMGWEKEQWVNDFFKSMRPLFAEVPLFPVLGNHDRNAMLYYELMALPKPYYYYSFRAGDAEIFTLDTEHEVGPSSAQYRWLEEQLKKSKARWKIVAHHYPPYSSDLDDYGTDFGDTAARELTPLYDRYAVDLVFSGHIHSYERTHPLRMGKIAKNGTVYLVVGGGGGDLEQFLPNPPEFSAVRKSDHHYGIVDIAPDTLTFSAYDLHGTLFDVFTLRK